MLKDISWRLLEACCGSATIHSLLLTCSSQFASKPKVLFFLQGKFWNVNSEEFYVDLVIIHKSQDINADNHNAVLKNKDNQLYVGENEFQVNVTQHCEFQ